MNSMQPADQRNVQSFRHCCDLINNLMCFSVCLLFVFLGSRLQTKLQGNQHMHGEINNYMYMLCITMENCISQTTVELA